MRQASWNEMFPVRRDPLVLAPEVPEEPHGWLRLLWWEDLVTFGLLTFVFGVVVTSVDRAHWVDQMPSLLPIAFFGLVAGALAARVRWPEGFIHLLMLPLGAAAALGQILAILPGHTPVQRFEVLTTRMGDWFAVAFGNGISNENLPFIVLVVPLAWLAAYLSAWAVFRWRNPWLALAPGGAALLMNISYLPGRFSFAFVLFLLSGTLLVTRIHVLDRAKAWRDNGTPYPWYLSLSVLHTTFWVAIALVTAAWLMPRADQVRPLESLWHRATAPATSRVEGLARLFVGVNNHHGTTRVHDFEDILPFLGSIKLPGTRVAEVTADPLDQPRYLRSQTFDVYTKSGWRLRSQLTSQQSANDLALVDQLLLYRLPINVQVTTSGETEAQILAIGQPRRVDRSVVLHWLSVTENVTSVASPTWLPYGDTYGASGSISLATEEQLRAAGTDYPSWVSALYRQLPDDLPQRVRALAQDLAASQPTPYDQSVAIESYLRQIPFDLNIPDTPPGRDAIDFFLFDAKRGYFDYHASAMVVLLRSVGVPARLAVGYSLQDSERAAGSDSYQVTEKNAFAWPEVYFPGLGWVEFNPTPSLPAVRRPLPQPAGGGTENQNGGLGLGLGLGNLPRDTGGATDLAPAGPADAGSGGVPWLWVALAGGLVALVSVGGGLRYAWVRGLGGLAPPARLWEQTVRLASWARLPPATSQTPYEYADTLRQRVAGVDDVRALADAYVRYQFGREQLARADGQRLEGAWRVIRGRLLRRLLRLR